MGIFHDSGEALKNSAEARQTCSTLWGFLKAEERAWLGCPMARSGPIKY
jgi:hypothetical protein